MAGVLDLGIGIGIGMVGVGVVVDGFEGSMETLALELRKREDLVSMSTLGLA